MRLRGEKRSHSTANGASMSQSPDEIDAITKSDSSQSSVDDNHHATAEATATVGGDDVDSDRPAKYARISDDELLSGMGASEDNDDEDELASPNEGEALPVSPAGKAAPDFDRLDEPFSSQLASPEPDATPTASQTLESPAAKSSRIPAQLKGKKRKGWHLRKENRSLHPAIAKGSPARSERQASVDTQDHQYEPGGILKRLPGRRRAPHGNPKIEAAMRRQLELKIAYRQVAKSVKPLLAEIAQRTGDSLESDEHFHEQFPQYEQIIACLDDHLQARLQQINSFEKLESARLERMRDAGEHIVRQRFEAALDDAYDDNIKTIERQVLQILRQSEQQRDVDATDDEDGIIPGQFGLNKSTGQRALMDKRYDSRSRVDMLTGEKWAYMHDRSDFQAAQKECDPASLIAAPKDFAWYDAQQRAEARAGVNLITLLDASARIEHNAIEEKRRAERESEARLQILASASELAPQPIPAPVKIEDAGSAGAIGTQPPPEKPRNHALSISNLVSKDPLAVDSAARPPWNPSAAEYGMQPPSFAPHPESVSAEGRQALPLEPKPETAPPQRPTSEYPPHPLGERRSEYPSLAALTQPQPPTDAFGYYAYQSRFEHDYPRPYEPPAPPSYDRQAYYAQDTRYGQAYAEAPYGTDRRGKSLAMPQHESIERDRYRYGPPRAGEPPQSPGHYRHDSHAGPPQPAVYGHLSTSRIAPPVVATQDYRQEYGSRPGPPAPSPRLMYDPARPDRPMPPREQPPAYYDRLPRGSHFAEIRPWNGAPADHGHEEPERWRHYSYHAGADPGTARPGYPDPPLQDQRPTQYGQYPSYQAVSGRPTSPPDGQSKSSKQKRRDGRRNENDKQRADELSFRQYQPQGSQPQQATPDNRHAQIQPATPSTQHQSPMYAPAPPAAGQPSSQQPHLAPGFDNPPNSSMSMQRHPGQRIGQQLLPATLDPNRASTSQPQSLQSSPSVMHGHNRQRSSTNSAHAQHESERGYAGATREAGPLQRGASPAGESAGGSSSWQHTGQQGGQQAGSWPGFEGQYPPPGPLTQQGMTGKLYPAGGRRRPAAIPAEGPPPAPPVIHFWQAEPAGGRAATFIHTGQNGEQPTTKNLDGRYWRNRRPRPSPPPPA